jgi:hypothetical protein
MLSSDLKSRLAVVLIPGFDQPARATVLGSGFELYDSIQINEQPVTATFTDSEHVQAIIPAALTGATGTVQITVVSRYTGASNSMTLPMCYPVPVLDGLTTGCSDINFRGPLVR